MKRPRSAAIEKRLQDEERFAVHLPNLFRTSLDDTDVFSGLTVFLGDNNAVVIGVKRLPEGANPQIMWTSGTDLVDAFNALELALKTGKWRDDKRHPDYKK